MPCFRSPRSCPGSAEHAFARGPAGWRLRDSPLRSWLPPCWEGLRGFRRARPRPWDLASQPQGSWTWRCCAARSGRPRSSRRSLQLALPPRTELIPPRMRGGVLSLARGLPARGRLCRRRRRQRSRARLSRAPVRPSPRPGARARPPNLPQLPALPRIRAPAATPQLPVRDPSGRARHSDRDSSNERSARSMLNRVVHHIRSNAVAYVALFVALGGTSYAALKPPANSVGTKQIKNHSITPVKLDPGKTGAVVRFWAVVGAAGSGEQVVASHPKARITHWDSGLGAGTVSWQQPFARN